MTTIVATVKADTDAASAIPRVYSITTQPISSGALANQTLVTSTNSQTGRSEYQLQRADGSVAQGNIAANGNVSFYSNGKAHVFSNGFYLGELGIGSTSPSVLAGGMSGDYSYHPGSGEISRRSNTTGCDNVIAGFAWIENMKNGSAWGYNRYPFDNLAADLLNDHAIVSAMSNGDIERSVIENLVNATINYLTHVSTLNPPTTPTACFAPDPSPIRTFYESRSSTSDQALSIAEQTLRIVDSTGAAVTATDKMQGDKGDDWYIVNSVNDVIFEESDEGYDTVVSSTNYILNANIEELRLLEGHTINGTGNRLDNKIVGNSQDNILDGVTGADLMIGGLGNDTYDVDNIGDQVLELAGEGNDTVNASISYILGEHIENLHLLDFSKAEKGMADGTPILVYGYPKAHELDYMQGDAVVGYKGTCALTSIANLATQANQVWSEAQVVQRAIDNHWAVTDPSATDYQRGGSNYLGQQALLDSYGIRNGILMGYNEQAIANLIKGGRGVIIGLNAGKLWQDDAYLDHGAVNHMVTVTGVACDASNGSINGFYIADSGRGLVSDMTRYVSIADFRAEANVTHAYAIYTVEPIKLWEENINGTGNALDNTLIGNRGNNLLTGGQGNDSLIGGAGHDTYVFHQGDGQDTIADHDATLGNTDVLQLTDLNQTDLWFRHEGDNLQINVLGSADQIIVKDWYVGGISGTDNQIEQIRTADGLTIHHTDVEQLVQAMASFAPPAAAQMNRTNSQIGNAQVLLSVSH